MEFKSYFLKIRKLNRNYFGKTAKIIFKMFLWINGE